MVYNHALFTFDSSSWFMAAANTNAIENKQVGLQYFVTPRFFVLPGQVFKLAVRVSTRTDIKLVPD